MTQQTHGRSNRPPETVQGFFPGNLNVLERVVPVPGLLSAEQVDYIRKDPDAAAEVANAFLRAAAADYRGNATKGDDPHERLEGILTLERPLLPIFTMLRQMRSDRPNQRSERATWIRREAMCHLCAQKALRSGTLAQLTCGDGGHLHFAEGKYRLKVDSIFFKNGRAGRLRNGAGYNEEIEDIEDCYSVFDEWLRSGREAMYGGSISNKLFVTRGSGGMSRMLIANEVRLMTQQYLADGGPRGTGFPGVVRFGPQGFRHIVATHTLKTTQDLMAAALAIWDHPKTVLDHYARYLPEDARPKLVTQWNEVKLLLAANADEVEARR